MISGVISAAFSHSGCRYSLQCLLAMAACFSAQAKSDLLKITTFSSCACAQISGRGVLNFLGDSVIQSHCPLRGDEPEVSIWVRNPRLCSALHKALRLCIKGSPPVITAVRPGWRAASSASPLTGSKGCLEASQLSFTSHQ